MYFLKVFLSFLNKCILLLHPANVNFHKLVINFAFFALASNRENTVINFEARVIHSSSKGSLTEFCLVYHFHLRDIVDQNVIEQLSLALVCLEFPRGLLTSKHHEMRSIMVPEGQVAHSSEILSLRDRCFVAWIELKQPVIVKVKVLHLERSDLEIILAAHESSHI